MLRLVIEDDEGKTIVVPLIRDEITIGRKEGNIIRLTERNVSRHHARLVRAGDDADPAVLVEDLESYNGVRLNGDRVAGKCTMRPGDLIQIGDYSLALRVDQPAGKDDDAAPTSVDTMPTEVHRVEPDVLAEEAQARLVAVSSNLAGEEFLIGLREVIMGRTDENDVVVNHRSISRNHAKVIVRDGVFTIIDLASSNGVRINGEPFGTATLVNGDIIQLGHVKLRFVAPGDDYVFTPADVDDVELDVGPSTGRLMLLALLLVGVAIVAFLLVNRTGREGPGSAGEPTKPISKPVRETPPPPPSDTTIDVRKLVDEGKVHLRAEKWTEAANVFGRVLQSEPNHAQAEILRKQARAEFDNKRDYEKLLRDVTDEQWSDAFFALEDFPTDSAYHARLSPMRRRIEKGFSADELARGRMLVDEGSFEAAQQVQQALAEKSFARRQAETLRRLIEKAEKKAARTTERTVAEKPRAEDKTSRPAGTSERRPARGPDERRRPEASASKPAVSAGGGDEYEKMMRKALTLMARGQRDRAVEQLELAHRVQPSSHMPHQRLCAILKPMGRLKKALRHCKMWLKKEPKGNYKPQIRRIIQVIEAELAQ